MKYIYRPTLPPNADGAWRTVQPSASPVTDTPPKPEAKTWLVVKIFDYKNLRFEDLKSSVQEIRKSQKEETAMKILQ